MISFDIFHSILLFHILKCWFDQHQIMKVISGPTKEV